MQPITNKIINIFWLPWSWKSLMATCMTCDYTRIFANFEIYKIEKFEQKFWKKKQIYKKLINNLIKSYSELQQIEYNNIKWLLIIDEAWINFNSRNSMSNINKKFNELMFVSRKKNLDIIIIWQLFFTIDKVLRQLSTYNFVMNWKKGENFEYFIYKNTTFGEILLWTKKINLLKILSNLKLEYNTLDVSILQ